MTEISLQDVENVRIPASSRGPGRPALGVDWNLIRRRYEVGMSLRDCARGQPITSESVRVRAKRDGWQRKNVPETEIKAAQEQAADLPSFQAGAVLTASRTPEKAGIIIANLRKGIGLKRVAALAGISNSTLTNWLDADPEFARLCEHARNDALGKIESALHETATKGDVAAQKFVLKTAKETREEYREEEQRVAVSLSLSFHRGGETPSELPPILDVTPSSVPAESAIDLLEESDAD